jgi:hypothetical protein
MTNVTEQLTLLLDLKQKQANASEARSSRMQAEQALKQANETARQGTSIMLVGTLYPPSPLTIHMLMQTVYYRDDFIRTSGLMAP